MNSNPWVSLSLAFILFFVPAILRAEPDVSENAKETVHDVKKGTKKAARKVKDKTCELVDGKMSCAGKKLKHKAQNVGDDIDDAVK